MEDLAASFQAAVVEVLCEKTRRAAVETGLERVVVAGGVACNRGLRQAMETLSRKYGLEIIFPSPALCGDNAAMLGVAGDYYLEHGVATSLDLNAVASWPLDLVSAPGSAFQKG